MQRRGESQFGHDYWINHARDAEGVELAQIQAVDRRAVAVMGIVIIVGTGIITVLR